MSDISVNVTNAGAASVAVSNGSTVNATVGNGGTVKVSLGTVSPGNATVVSGTLQIGKVTTLAAGSPATATNVGTSYAAIIDLGIPQGAAGAAGKDGKDGITPALSIGSVTTGAAGSSATVTATTTDGGSKVLLDFTIPRGDTGATGSGGSSVSLSDATPQPLGTAAAGVSTSAARADHVHAAVTASGISDFTTAASAAAPVQSVAGRQGDVVLTATDISGLSDALAAATSEVVDGGDYVGVVVVPTPSITITAQPANYSGTVGTASAQVGSLPSGTWRSFNASYGNSAYWLTAYDFSGGDYYAVSSDGVNWQKRYGLNRPGQWYAAVHGSGKTVITDGTYAQISTDGTTWSESAVAGRIFHANGKWFRYTGQMFTSDDLSTWSSGSSLVKSYTGSVSLNSLPASGSLSGVVYFGGKYVAFFDRKSYSTYTSGGQNYATGLAHVFYSTDGTTWTASEDVGGYYGAWTNGAWVNQWAATNPASPSSPTYPRFTRPQVVNGELWVTPGSGYVGYARAAVTSDGVTWSLRSFGGGSTNQQTNQIAYGAGQYVSTGAFGIYSSTNGTTWTQRTASGWTSYGFDEANFVDSAFWIIGRNRTDALRSDDGISWTRLTGLTAFEAIDRVQNGSSFVGVNIGNVTQSIKLGLSGSAVLASFSVAAFFSGSTLSYQWQVSTDAGSTWSNIADATSPTLSFSATTADNGKRYRVQISATGASTVTSNSATLTVT